MIKKNYFYNLIYQILILIIPLITFPYLSRILGAELIGEYSYKYSIVNYFIIFIMLGLNNYGNRTIAMVRDNLDKLSTTFYEIYLIQFCQGILILIIYLFYCFFITKNNLIFLIMTIFIIASIFDVNWFFYGLEKFKFLVIRNIIIKLLMTISIFKFVKEKKDIYIYCIILALGTLVSNIILYPYILNQLKKKKIKIKNVVKHIKPNLYLFLTVLAVSLFKIMDKIMLGMMTNNIQVGYYEAAEKIINIPLIMIVSLGNVMLPRISNIINEYEKKTKELIYKSILFSFFLSTSMGFGIMGISKEFVPIFYGEGYKECSYLFLILLPSCFFLAFANVVRTQYILPKKMDDIYVKSAFLGAIVNLIINFFLIPLKGAIGASIGTLFAEIVVCIYQVIRVRKYLPISLYIKKGIPFFISGIVMFSIIYFINFKNIPIIYVLLIKIILGAILYLLLLLMQMCYKEKNFIKNIKILIIKNKK